VEWDQSRVQGPVAKIYRCSVKKQRTIVVLNVARRLQKVIITVCIHRIVWLNLNKKRMRNLTLKMYLLLSMYLMSGACYNFNPSSHAGFVIKGDIMGYEDSIIYFSYPDSIFNQFIIDTIPVKNEHFEYKGEVANPTVYYMFKSPRSEGRNLFVENHVITIKGNTDSLNKAKVEGSTIQIKYDSLQKSLDKSAHAQERMNLRGKFIKNHPHSYISAYLLNGYFGDQQSTKQLAQLLEGLDSLRQHSLYGRWISEKMHWDTMGFPNHPAYVFEALNMEGEKFSLSDQRGKYVLLDFWAS